MKPFQAALLILIVLAAVGNCVVYTNFPFDTFVTALSLQGLFITGLGSVLLLLADLPGAHEYLRDTDLDDQIAAARHTLFVEQESLKFGDPGFDKTVDIIIEHSNLSERPDFVHPREPGTMGAVGYVSFIYGNEVSSDEKVERTASQPVVDGWLNQYVERQKQQTEVRWIHRGAWFFLVGFVLQIGASLSKLLGL